MKRYYVTVRDAGRTGWLLGPYDTHALALENVERGRRLAEQANAYAHFYAFGTASVDGERQPRTVFGA